MRLFRTSMDVRQLHKHDGTKWDCLVPQWLSDNFTNMMGQSETVYYLKGCQTTSQTQWDNVRLFSTSRVVRQLHKHDGTKLDCLVPQWWSTSQTRQIHKHDWTKRDCLVPQWLSDKFTNTMGQSETLVPLGLSDNYTNTMGQRETV